MKVDVTFREEGKKAGTNRDAFAKFRRIMDAIPEAASGKEIQQVLAAGARAMARFIQRFLDAATDPDPARVHADGAKPLRSVIRGRQGKPEWEPSAMVLLVGRGARHIWLVDQGHAGPRPDSPRTPPHPFVLEGIDASEGERERAMFRTFQRIFPELAQKVRAIADA